MNSLQKQQLQTNELFRNKDYSEALKLYHKVLFIDHQNKESYIQIGEIYLARCDFSNAILHWRKVLELDAENAIKTRFANTLCAMGCIHYENKRYDQAIVQISEAIEIQSLEASFWVYRSLCYFAVQKYPEALRDINTGIALGRYKRCEVYLYRAKLLETFTKYDQAKSDYEKACVMNSKHPDVIEYKNRLLLKSKENYDKAANLILQGKWSEALECLLKSKQITPNNIEMYILLAHCRRELGLYDEALNDIETGEKIPSIKSYAKDFNRQRCLVFNDMALNFKVAEDYDQAITYMNKVIEIETKWNKEKPNYRFFMNRGDIYRTICNYQFAIADYHKALDLDPKNWELKTRCAIIHNTIGEELYNSKQYEQAIAAFSQAIDCNPKVAQFYINRANCNFSLYNFPESYIDYKRAQEIDPNNAKIRLKLSQLQSNYSDLKDKPVRLYK